MISLKGEYECKIDDRGRFKLPQKLIEALGDRRTLDFVINRGFDNNIILYPKEVWDEKILEINQLNIYDKKQRDVLRYFYRGATDISNDSADRILIPSHLKEYAGIEKDIVLFAYSNIIEIWSKVAFDKMISSEPEDFSTMLNEAMDKLHLAPRDV